MLNYIHEMPNPIADEFNRDFLDGTLDTPIEDFVMMVMQDFESVENIEILSVETIWDMDEIDYNRHTININYKRKNLAAIEIPTNKFVAASRYFEMIFKIKITTNLNSVIIEKPLLVPLADEDDGSYLINSKIFWAIWQLCDANTYTQRGRVTFKSRMPVIIYQTRNRQMTDTTGTDWVFTSYSYAMDTKTRRRGAKKKTKFINPLMIFAAKMGMHRALSYFGMDGIIHIVNDVDEDATDFYAYFPFNDLYVRVPIQLLKQFEIVQACTCMLLYSANKDFPVTQSNLDDTEYWICRVGYIGSIKNSSILSFRDKGYTTIHMIERLYDKISQKDLRIPDPYRENVYTVIQWMIWNYDALKSKNNLDMMTKRIRRNEYIVMSSLGKKVSENINKLIEKKSKSKMNTMETLLELFNFPSDIILSGMRNIPDTIKSDEIVNDMNFLMRLMYTSKGPNSLGENSSKMIPVKYRYPHPSQVGIVDLNVSSNQDPGMSGSFVPFVQLYDGLFFNPERDPCEAEYRFQRDLKQFLADHKDLVKKLPELKSSPVYQKNAKTFETFEKFMKFAEAYREQFSDELKYLPICIVEKDPSTLSPIGMVAATEQSTENGGT